MTMFHAVVWIDHQSAQIVGYEPGRKDANDPADWVDERCEKNEKERFHGISPDCLTPELTRVP